MSIGDNIRAIRKERKLTQEEFAKQAGISRSYLSDIENNRKNPSTKTIETLADKINVTLYYVLTGKKSFLDRDFSEGKLTGQITTFGTGEDAKKTKLKLKKELEYLLASDLSYLDATYLTKMINFLKNSDIDGVLLLSDIASRLTSVLWVKSEGSLEDDKEGFKGFLTEEFNLMTEFIHDYIFEKGECE